MNSEAGRLLAVTVVPAQAGTYLLVPVVGEPEDQDMDAEDMTLFFETVPVVAWRIMTYKGLSLERDEEFPIVIGGIGGDPLFVEFPDGRVWSYGFDMSFVNADACLEYVRKVERRRKIALDGCACGEC